MLKIWALCLTLGVLPAFGGSRETPVRLYTQFQYPPPDAVLEALQAELDTVMQPSRLDLQWRSLESATGSEVSPELVVVHFKGHCDVNGLLSVGAYAGPLGWTHLSDGEILPFVDINCDAVRLFLQRGLIHLPDAERPTAFGRAVARVMAHELYHALARTTKHGSSGIAKPAYSMQELLGARFEFASKQCDVLRAHELHLEEVNAVAGQ